MRHAALITLLFMGVSSLLGLENRQKIVPGFLGSRHSIRAGIAPSFGEFIRPFAEYEYVTSRRNSWTFQVVSSTFELNPDQIESAYTTSGTGVYLDPMDRGSRIYLREGGIQARYKTFLLARNRYYLNKGSIAPQGKYFRYGLLFSVINFENDMIFEDLKLNPNRYSHRSSGKRETLFFQFELGVKRFISKNLFINQSITFNVPYSFWSGYETVSYEDIKLYGGNALEMIHHSRNTFNLSLSLGFAF